VSETFDFFSGSVCKMERVHQLVTAGNRDAADDHDFWSDNWHHIASAKVPLDTKVAAYKALNLRGVVDINNTFMTKDFYSMVVTDRAFVAALNLNARMLHRYRVCVIWIDDDAEALARYDQELSEKDPAVERSYRIRYDIWYVLATINSPRCARFLLQDRAVREEVMQARMPPLVQQLVEELVQPTDRLDRWSLFMYGQSAKLIGMCAKDEELVAVWLKQIQAYPILINRYLSIMLARKLHALATPEQKVTIANKIMERIHADELTEGYFELVWLCGLLGSHNQMVRARFLKRNVRLFPAFTFAMIVAMCDGYLEAAHGITGSQKRFFTLAMRLPMDLQSLLSLRLWGCTSSVIQGDMFNRALFAVI
jgi:hypothetical protein